MSEENCSLLKRGSSLTFSVPDEGKPRADGTRTRTSLKTGTADSVYFFYFILLFFVCVFVQVNEKAVTIKDAFTVDLL